MKQLFYYNPKAIERGIWQYYTSIGLEFNLRDCWIGVYWKYSHSSRDQYLHVYICLVPCLVIHFDLHRTKDWD